MKNRLQRQEAINEGSREFYLKKDPQRVVTKQGEKEIAVSCLLR